MAKRLFSILLLLTACNPVDPSLQIPASATLCPSTVTEIGVGDGYLETLCGCKEGGPTFFFPNQPLTCTFAAGNEVIFFFFGKALRHQIISVGTPSFVSSPIMAPESNDAPNVHAVQLNTPGTYAFADSMDMACTGSLVAQ